MNSEIKEKWVTALRSGKYQQGTDFLRANDQYCCLGVLCDLYAKEHDTVWKEVGEVHHVNYYSFFSAETELPGPVMKWAGLSHTSPFVSVPLELADHLNAKLDEKGVKAYFWDEEFPQLATLNDAEIGFNVIADLIEQDTEHL